jgi:hypothetical protein
MPTWGLYREDNFNGHVDNVNRKDVVNVYIESYTTVSDSVNVTLHPTLNVINMTPSYGLISGGTSVAVELNVPSPPMLTFQGIFSVEGSDGFYVDVQVIRGADPSLPSSLSIISPPLSLIPGGLNTTNTRMPIKTRIQITASNGYQLPPISYNYLPSTIYNNISPSQISEDGGIITIHGDILLIADFYCRFDNVDVKVTSVGENYLECLAPPHAVGVGEVYMYMFI